MSTPAPTSTPAQGDVGEANNNKMSGSGSGISQLGVDNIFLKSGGRYPVVAVFGEAKEDDKKTMVLLYLLNQKIQHSIVNKYDLQVVFIGRTDSCETQVRALCKTNLISYSNMNGWERLIEQVKEESMNTKRTEYVVVEYDPYLNPRPKRKVTHLLEAAQFATLLLNLRYLSKGEIDLLSHVCLIPGTRPSSFHCYSLASLIHDYPVLADIPQLKSKEKKQTETFNPADSILINLMTK